MKTCGDCSHFKKLDSRPNGECYALPPTASRGGWPGVRPIVGRLDQRCSHFQEVPSPVICEHVQTLTNGNLLAAEPE